MAYAYLLRHVTAAQVGTYAYVCCDAGLVVVSGTSRNSNAVPAGHVISTDPAGGARIRHGGKVVLIT